MYATLPPVRDEFPVVFCFVFMRLCSLWWSTVCHVRSLIQVIVDNVGFPRSSEVVRFARRHLKKHGNVQVFESVPWTPGGSGQFGTWHFIMTGLRSVQSTCEALVQRALVRDCPFFCSKQLLVSLSMDGVTSRLECVEIFYSSLTS